MVHVSNKANHCFLVWEYSILSGKHAQTVLERGIATCTGSALNDRMLIMSVSRLVVHGKHVTAFLNAWLVLIAYQSPSMCSQHFVFFNEP